MSIFNIKPNDQEALVGVDADPTSTTPSSWRNQYDPKGGRVGKHRDGGFRPPGGSNHEASNRMAGLLRRDWDNYLEDYAPYDAKLREMVMGDTDNQAAIERARTTSNAAFDASQGALERDRSRLGLSMAADESKAIQDRSALNRTLSEVGTVNKTRMHMADRDMQMMAGNMAGAGLRDAATDTARTR